jgi:hypothetical protein
MFHDSKNNANDAEIKNKNRIEVLIEEHKRREEQREQEKSEQQLAKLMQLVESKNMQIRREKSGVIFNGVLEVAGNGLHLKYRGCKNVSISHLQRDVDRLGLSPKEAVTLSLELPEPVNIYTPTVKTELTYIHPLLRPIMRIKIQRKKQNK